MTPAVDTVLAQHTRADGAVVTLAAMAPTGWRRAEYHVTVRRERALVSRHTLRLAQVDAARDAFAAACGVSSC